MLLALLLAACTPAATITDGTWTLSGVRTSLDDTMEAWPGPAVDVQVGATSLQLGRIVLPLTPWPRADWVDGCWTMQGTTEQEVRELDCDAPTPLAEGVDIPCPAILLASCPDGANLALRAPLERDGSTTGCGESPFCAWFERP